MRTKSTYRPWLLNGFNFPNKKSSCRKCGTASSIKVARYEERDADVIERECLYCHGLEVERKPQVPTVEVPARALVA